MSHAEEAEEAEELNLFLCYLCYLCVRPFSFLFCERLPARIGVPGAFPIDFASAGEIRKACPPNQYQWRVDHARDP
jgi:hypothetical protein